MMLATGMMLQRAVAQSALDPAGPQAARILNLLLFAVGAATAMYLLTIAALAFATWRARKRTAGEHYQTADGRFVHEMEHAERKLPENAQRRVREERTMTRAVGSGVALSVLVLLAFLTYDLSVGRAMTPSPRPNPLIIELTGTQWWWQVEYPDSTPQNRITTANEIHVPVGEPVVLLLSSKDVIHSVWVPNLDGKKDLVPGYTQSAWFQADTAGTYRGQCAEFCGHQHAKMGLVVVAEPRAQFEAWQVASRKPQAPPTDSAALTGQTVFMNGTCVMCHAIEGTPAGSRNGPNLTHFASRKTIAAATLENTRENLAKWVTDPQGVKPGTRMPPSRFTPAELDALLTYLQSLK
jgi:cytochrome c oxidase subunit II